jgi:hypothetical protein
MQGYKTIRYRDVLGQSYLTINRNEEVLRSNFAYYLEEDVEGYRSPVLGQRFFCVTDGSWWTFRGLSGGTSNTGEMENGNLIHNKRWDGWFKDEDYGGDKANAKHLHEGQPYYSDNGEVQLGYQENYSKVGHVHDARYALKSHIHGEFSLFPELLSFEPIVGSFHYTSVSDAEGYVAADGRLCLWEDYPKLRAWFERGGLYPSSDLNDRWWRYFSESSQIFVRFRTDMDADTNCIYLDSGTFTLGSVGVNDAVWSFTYSKVSVDLDHERWKFGFTPVNKDLPLLKRYFIESNFSVVIETSDQGNVIEIPIKLIEGLYVPDLQDIFLRGASIDKAAGMYEIDQFRRIAGCLGQMRYDYSNDLRPAGLAGRQSAPFYSKDGGGETQLLYGDTVMSSSKRDFALTYMDTALLGDWAAGEETRPKNIRVYIMVYVG